MQVQTNPHKTRSAPTTTTLLELAHGLQLVILLSAASLFSSCTPAIDVSDGRTEGKSPSDARPSGDEPSVRGAPSSDAANENRAEAPRWFIIELDGQPAGTIRETEKSEKDGGVTVIREMKLEFRRAEGLQSLEAREELRENAAGRLIAFNKEQRLSKLTSRVSGQVDGSKIKVVSTSAGSPDRKSEHPFDPQTYGDVGLRRLAAEKLRGEGDKLEATVFLSDVVRNSSQKMVSGPMETIRVGDADRRLRKVYVRIEAQDLPITQWVDDEFRMVVFETTLLGKKMRTFEASAEAIGKLDLSSPPEIFFSSAITPNRALSSTAETQRYRLSLPQDATAAPSKGFVQPKGAGLAIVEGSAKSKSWVVDVQTLLPLAALKRPVTVTAELSEFLDPNSWIQSDDPAIAEEARRIVGEEDDVWKSSLALERWVFENVREKNLNTAFASASEVYKERSGDCTEHSVLLAALARAVQIPARITAGLVYHRGQFVGHMWTEVWCGRWIALDGTRGKGSVGPDHIALSTSSLSQSTMGELMLSLLPLLGRLKIDLLPGT